MSLWQVNAKDGPADDLDSTALHRASATGVTDVVKVLLQARADMSLKNKKKKGPLALALKNSGDVARRSFTALYSSWTLALSPWGLLGIGLEARGAAWYWFESGVHLQYSTLQYLQYSTVPTVLCCFCGFLTRHLEQCGCPMERGEDDHILSSVNHTAHCVQITYSRLQRARQ